MKGSYIFGHWVLTLLLAPFTSQALYYFISPNPHQIAGLLEVYPIVLAFSIVFSLPTFVVYLAFFYFLDRNHVRILLTKLILISIAVIGIYVTMTIMKGSMTNDIIAAYTLTALVVGIILRLKKKSMSAIS